MTAIVGLVHGGVVHIGGDSAGVDGWSLTIRADAKVFRNGPYVMGFSGSFRMGQLLRYALAPPEPDGELEPFMATTFIDAVRKCLKEGGWASKENEREEGGVFLVGVHGRLFCVCNDYQVGEAADGYAAVGCGDDLALGALYATARSRMAPQKRLRLALEAAERFSSGVRGPYAFVSTDKSARGGAADAG
jgi:ATP-dependent protease HslVU (ClpYQ) peptidase subunit